MKLMLPSLSIRKFSFVSVLVGLVLFSCQKETPVVNPPVPVDRVELAEAWFARSVPNTKAQRDTAGKNHRQRLAKQPDWERALVRETEGGYEVWAPLIYEQNLTAYNDNGEVLYRLNDQAFLRLANAKGEFTGYQVLLYLSGKEMESMPLTMDSYEGMVLAEDWQGNPLQANTHSLGDNPSPRDRQVETTWECTTTRWYTCGVNRNEERVNCHLTDVEVDCVPIGGGNQYLVFPPERLAVAIPAAEVGIPQGRWKKGMLILAVNRLRLQIPLARFRKLQFLQHLV